jgi:excisionase family DNA binding protein
MRNNQECRNTGIAEHNTGAISEKIKEWAKGNDWYRIEVNTNQLKLERGFGAAIDKIASQLDYHNRSKHRRQVFDCWDNLTAKCRQIDLVCRAGCRSEEELLELEFLRSKAVGAATELSEVIQIIQNEECKIENGDKIGPGTTDFTEINCDERKNNSSDCYITFAQAAELLAVGKGTVSKWAAAGRMTDNGLKGQKRKLLKSSVLLVKQEMEDEEIKKDVKELRKDASIIR